MSKLNRLGAYNIFDLRDIAAKRLPKFLFDFVDRGAEDEIAVRNNRAALDRIKLNPRMLVDVSVRSQEIMLFGNKQSMPIAIAPTGAAGLLWHEGEIALARAARAAGIPFTLATNSITPMEKVAEQAGGRLWFQLYMWADRSMSHQLIQRAKSVGYEALVVTVDSVTHPNREYNQHNGYTRPFTLNRKNVTDVLTHPRWLFNVFARYHDDHRHAAPRKLSGLDAKKYPEGHFVDKKRIAQLGRSQSTTRDVARQTDGERNPSSQGRDTGRRLRCGRGDRLQSWRP